MASVQTQLPTVQRHGQGTNAVRLEIGDVTLYFSYETLIGFHVLGKPPVVRRNEWGPTTGKHMTAIPGMRPAERIPADEFAERFASDAAPRIARSFTA